MACAWCRYSRGSISIKACPLVTQLQIRLMVRSDMRCKEPRYVVARPIAFGPDQIFDQQSQTNFFACFAQNAVHGAFAILTTTPRKIQISGKRNVGPVVPSRSRPTAHPRKAAVSRLKRRWVFVTRRVYSPSVQLSAAALLRPPRCDPMPSLCRDCLAPFDSGRRCPSCGSLAHSSASGVV